MKKTLVSIVLIFCCISCTQSVLGVDKLPKMPIGMNLPSNNYYTTGIIFKDVMKTASKMITFNSEGDSPWNTELLEKIACDENGYPLEIPAKVTGASPQRVRFLFNNNYPAGRYLLSYDGEGELVVQAAATEKKDGQTYIIIDGTGGHRWIDIKSSQKGNHIRNIHIISEKYLNDDIEKEPFHPLFLKGLEPFHALRFMDWVNTNGSRQQAWQDRSKKTYYSQGLGNGIAIEYAIELCNTLKADAWFCVPHMADDDYIRNFAKLAANDLRPDLQVYIEYSNEIWNWGFEQSHWILKNAPGAVDKYVIEDLQAINPESQDHPEKDAYMMQRVFGIWQEEFQTAERGKLVRVAAVQHAWHDNTRRILSYLFKKDGQGRPITGPRYIGSTGAGCDAVSPAGYFSFGSEDHERWNGMKPEDVRAEMVIDAMANRYPQNSGLWTEKTAEYARQWNVDYVVYEGGQHAQPYQQKDWGYNRAVWEAQIHPGMYDMYMTLFRKHTEPLIDCKLFCAFSYVSGRESKYGSWGHLENLEQLNDLEKIKKTAPKYSALLDVNEKK